MRFLGLLLISSLMLSLAGCGGLTARISSTGLLPAQASGETIAVVAAHDVLDRSLFFRRTRGMIETELRAKGFTVVQPGDAPLFLALASYEAGEGRTETFTTERLFPRYVFRKDIGNVFVGYDRIVEVRQVETFGRQVRLVIERMDSPEGPQRVYEGTAESRGRCPNINEVAGVMYQALFRKFPEGSGQVTVESEVTC